MSQARVRQAPGGSDASVSRAKVANSAGDTAPGLMRTEQGHKKTKSRLPKSIQYDLDNALVGLCDVWFEEIKPHLVRNNIKLHVERAGAAASDSRCLPSGAAGCSHYDPAGSASECQLCRLLFQAASSIESAVSQATIASASSSTGPASTASVLASVSSSPSVPTLDISDESHRGGPKESILTKPPSIFRCSKRNPSCKPYWDPMHSETRTVPVPHSPNTIIGEINARGPKAEPREDHIHSRDIHTKVPIQNIIRRVKTQDICCQTDLNLTTKNPPPKNDCLKDRDSITAFTIAAPIMKQRPSGMHRASQTATIKPKVLIRTVPNNISMKKSNKNLLEIIYPQRPYFDRKSNNENSNKDSICTRKRLSSLKGKCSIGNERPAVLPKKTIYPPERQESLLVMKSSRAMSLNRPCICPKSTPAVIDPNLSTFKTLTNSRMKAAFTGSRPICAEVGCKQSSGTTSFLYPIKNQQNRASRSLGRNREKYRDCNQTEKQHQLFDNELINIIAEKNDKKLKVLFRSSDNRESGSAIMNLYSPPEERRPSVVANQRKMLKVWR